MSARESLLRLNISCLDPHGSEIRKLRITLSITKTVQQLLQRIESHDGMEGCFYRYDRLRLKESGEWLHSDDVLLDILEPHETDFEAVPTDDGDDSDDFPIDTVQQQYIPRKEDLEDRRCNFLSWRVGSKMSIYASAHGWIYGADESGTRGFVPEWVFEAPDPDLHDEHDHNVVSATAETCRSHPRTRGVVKQIVAQTSGYVDKLTFHMRDGQEYVYGQGGHRECEYWLDPDEIIVSALQIEKESLGQIVWRLQNVNSSSKDTSDLENTSSRTSSKARPGNRSTTWKSRTRCSVTFTRFTSLHSLQTSSWWFEEFDSSRRRTQVHLLALKVALSLV